MNVLTRVGSLGLALVVAGALVNVAHAQTQNAAEHTTHAHHAKAKSHKGKAGKSTGKSSHAHHAVAATHRTKVHPSKAAVHPVVHADAEPAKVSFGQMAGLHNTQDPLALKSSVAYVLDQDTNEVLLNKNSDAVLPIASITKLMTAMVVNEANLPMDETLTVAQDDVDTEKFSRSRLRVGTQLTRGEMLHLALMSSENRAAHALGRYYPGGLTAFVSAMNAKAKSLGMNDTRYVEPTGLSSQNQSSARDLATLVKAAYKVPLIRELTTSPQYEVEVGHRPMEFHTTNQLVRSPEWNIGLQKTGYITEAGQCMVMQAKLAGRKLIMVLLDSAGKYSRIGDAERIRKWLLTGQPQAAAHGIRSTAG
ncbi:MAG: D-alanyl-D-alanine endopeptidase [Betaproteobacteria bacterium]|nr:D-alanyl-D-alanine endopeptidase [Betaproteobacteria bacterium]